MLETIHSEAVRLNEIINHFLDIKQLESGTRDLQISAVDVEKLVADCVSIAAPLATEKGIKIQNDSENSLPALPADAPLLTQAVVCEVRNNPQAARLLRTNANYLRESYQSALATNPDLKFGQFVAANMLARNLGSRCPKVTTAAILDGLAGGDSIGRTLKNLGLSSRQAKDAERRAKQMIEDDEDNF